MTKRSWSALYYACFAMLGLYLASYQNVVDDICAQFGLGGTVMGLIVALHFLGALAAPPLMGALADANGARVCVLLALGALAAGIAAICAGGTALVVSVGIFVAGCGYAALEGLMTSCLSRQNPDKVDHVVNLSQMWFCVGAVAGPFLSARCAEAFGNWRAGYAILAGLFTLAALGMARAPLAKPEPVEKGAPKLWTRPLLLSLCLSLGLYLGVEQGSAFFLGALLEGSGAGAWTSWALSAYWMGMILGRLYGCLRPGNQLRLAMAALTLSLAAQAGLLLLPSGGASVACAFAIGLLLALTWPALVARAADTYREQSGAATGLMMTAGSLGATAFPALMGALSEAADVRAAFLLMPALTLCCVFVSAFTRRAKK